MATILTAAGLMALGSLLLLLLRACIWDRIEPAMMATQRRYERANGLNESSGKAFRLSIACLGCVSIGIGIWALLSLF